jgi:serine/threonine protein kinase
MATALLSRNTNFGSIRLKGHIGTGGFSDVYEGFTAAGQRVAVKVLRSATDQVRSNSARFAREQEVLKRLDSRGAARLVDADLDNDPPWIASEFIDGISLSELIQRDGPLNNELTQALIFSLAGVVKNVHNAGIAHRDISPNNIILGPDGPVLIDFGSSRLESYDSQTGSRLFVGTDGYIAPEGLRGEPVGMSGDVYALTRVAQFCLTGLTPSPTDTDDWLGLFPELLRTACVSALVALPKDRSNIGSLESAFICDSTIIDSLDWAPRPISKLPLRFKLRTVVTATTLVSLLVTTLFLILTPDRTVRTSNIIAKGFDQAFQTTMPENGYLKTVPTIKDLEWFHYSDTQFDIPNAQYILSEHGLTSSVAESGAFEDFTDQDFYIGVIISALDNQSATELASYPDLSSELKVSDLAEPLLDQVLEHKRAAGRALFPSGCDLADTDTAEWTGHRLIIAFETNSLSCLNEAGESLDIEYVLLWEQATNTFAQIIRVQVVKSFRTRQFIEALSFQSAINQIPNRQISLETLASTTEDAFSAVLEFPPRSAMRLQSPSESDDRKYKFSWLDDKPLAAGNWWVRPESTYSSNQRIFQNSTDEPRFLHIKAQPYADRYADEMGGIGTQTTQPGISAIVATYEKHLDNDLNIDQLFNLFDKHFEDVSGFDPPQNGKEFYLPSATYRSAGPALDNNGFTEVTAANIFPFLLTDDIYQGGAWYLGGENDLSKALFLRFNQARELHELEAIAPDDPHLDLLKLPDMSVVIGSPYHWLDTEDRFTNTNNCWQQYRSYRRNNTELASYDIYVDIEFSNECIIYENNWTRRQATPLTRFTIQFVDIETDSHSYALAGEFVPGTTEDWASFLHSFTNNIEMLSSLSNEQIDYLLESSFAESSAN